MVRKREMFVVLDEMPPELRKALEVFGSITIQKFECLGKDGKNVISFPYAVALIRPGLMDIEFSGAFIDTAGYKLLLHMEECLRNACKWVEANDL